MSEIHGADDADFRASALPAHLSQYGGAPTRGGSGSVSSVGSSGSSFSDIPEGLETPEHISQISAWQNDVGWFLEASDRLCGINIYICYI